MNSVESQLKGVINEHVLADRNLESALIEVEQVLQKHHGEVRPIEEIVGVDRTALVGIIKEAVDQSIDIRTVFPEALDHGGLAEARDGYSIWIDVRNVKLDQNDNYVISPALEHATIVHEGTHIVFQAIRDLVKEKTGKKDRFKGVGNW